MDAHEVSFDLTDVRHTEGLDGPSMDGPYEPCDLTGTGLQWNPRPVEHHNRDYVHPGRLALAGFAVRPEDCPDNARRWVWRKETDILVCPTCGLDGT